jgi:hypothetical protein
VAQRSQIEPPVIAVLPFKNLSAERENCRCEGARVPEESDVSRCSRINKRLSTKPSQRKRPQFHAPMLSR